MQERRFPVRSALPHGPPKFEDAWLESSEIRVPSAEVNLQDETCT